MNIPKFFEFNHIYDENGTLQYWTSDLNENANYVVFSSYYECAVIGIIPLLALCYLNYKIYTGISKSAKSMTRHAGGTRSTSDGHTNGNRVQNGTEEYPLLERVKFRGSSTETPVIIQGQDRLSVRYSSIKSSQSCNTVRTTSMVLDNPNGISKSQSSGR